MTMPPPPMRDGPTLEPSETQVPLPRRIGLVLEGGGAKGAFQFGCLYALYKSGATFDVIAGTSVGALNAALWSTDQMEWGKEFWRKISFKKVYPLRNPFFIYLPLAIIYCIFKAIFVYSGGRPILSFVGKVMVAWFAGGAVILIMLSFLASVLLLILNDGTTGSPHKFGDIVIFLSTSIPMIYVIAVEYYGISAFSPEPLRTTISEQLSGKIFNVPVFATIAHQEHIFDPDHMEYGSTGIPPSAALSFPQPKFAFVPEYIRVDKEKASVTEALMATAALPYGVVPSIGGAVDGGVADNLPLFPLISFDVCDAVLVIRVAPDKMSDEEVNERWSDIDRLIRVAEYTEASALAATPNEPPRPFNVDVSKRKRPAEERRSPPHMPLVQFIVPDTKRSSRWRDFICGTMNFRARFTRHQFLIGFKMTRELIRDGKMNNFISRAKITPRESNFQTREV